MDFINMKKYSNYHLEYDPDNEGYSMKRNRKNEFDQGCKEVKENKKKKNHLSNYHLEYDMDKGVYIMKKNHK